MRVYSWVVCFAFCALVPAHACDRGMGNDLGCFSVTPNTVPDFQVSFTVAQHVTKFKKVARAYILDFGNDSAADIVEVQYRAGKRYVYLRDKDAHDRYLRMIEVTDLCGDNHWSREIVYEETKRAWRCRDIDVVEYLKLLGLFWYADEGLKEAREAKWGALSQRILTALEKHHK